MHVDIVEVSLRDGLQNFKADVSLAHRYHMVKSISLSGVRRMELGSFVSPKAVPQMECVPTLVKKVLRAQERGLLPKKVCYSAFVPNQYGFERAGDMGLKELSFFVSCTQGFSQHNINMSIKESLKVLKLICRRAEGLKIKIRVYLSVAFFCPYEGWQKPSHVLDLSQKIQDAGAFEISISDTVGMAVYKDVAKCLDILLKKIPVKRVALHFHDTRGMALANIIAGLKRGVRVFDSSVGGLGGCPYVPRGTGNVATEDLIYMLKRMGYKTNLDVVKITKVTRWLEKKFNISLPSKIKTNML